MLPRWRLTSPLFLRIGIASIFHKSIQMEVNMYVPRPLALLLIFLPLHSAPLYSSKDPDRMQFLKAHLIPTRRFSFRNFTKAFLIASSSSSSLLPHRVTQGLDSVNIFLWQVKTQRFRDIEELSKVTQLMGRRAGPKAFSKLWQVSMVEPELI